MSSPVGSQSAMGGDPVASRRGAVLMVALLCLLVVSLILAGMLRALSLQTKQARIGRLQLQSTWLANAGLGRAAAQLARDETYEGETWELTADRLNSRHDGVVKIQISATAGAPDKRKATIIADYPVDPARRVRTTKSALIALSHSE